MTGQKDLGLFLACFFLLMKTVKIFAFVPNEIKLRNVKKSHSHQILYFIFDVHLFPNQGENMSEWQTIIP